MQFQNIIGIDEAGRGPLAGPLSVAALKIKKDFNIEKSPISFISQENSFKDSKKLTEKRRQEIYSFISENKDIFEYQHIFVNANEIDSLGISHCLSFAVTSLLSKMDNSNLIILDAGLKAPENYNWESHKKADEKYLEVALASIIAKVLRDKYMIDISKKYPNYKFEKHKGYGTKEHIDLIKKYGPSKEHRISFLGNILTNSKLNGII